MMDSDSLIQLVQAGFRLSIGATASVMESLPDRDKREELLAKLSNSEFNLLIEEWGKKGEITEQEARKYVDSLFNQASERPSSQTEGTSNATPTPNPVVPPNVQLELQELTAQIAAMRAELEKLQRDSPP